MPPLTKAQLLAVAERSLPVEYIVAIKDVGPGYEILRAGAAVMERCSVAAHNADEGSYLIGGHGGARASAPVELYRTTTTAGAFTVKAGTVIRASRGGQDYLLEADVLFGPGDLFVAGIGRAVADGWEYNVRGPRTTARGETRAGEIDTVVLPLLEPPYAEPDLHVRQSADATGGRAATLDASAYDRGIEREPGEGDEALAFRAREVPDVVSPPAILRQVKRMLDPLGIEFEIVRWWEFRFQSATDAPVDTIPPDYAGSEYAIVVDDPRPLDAPGGWRNRVDGAAVMGAVVVIVDHMPAVEEYGIVVDDPGVTAADHVTRLGRYAFGAADMPSDGAIDALRGAVDGYDVGARAHLRRLWKMLDEITGGVPFYIELRGQ